MQIVKTAGSVPVLSFIERFEDVQGGASLQIADIPLTGTTGYVAITEIPAGTIVGDESPAVGKFHVVKTAKLHADATNIATTYQVKKNHLFKIGDIITTKDAASVKAYAITAIDYSNAGYDILTVGTTLGVALTAANVVVLVQVAATDATGGLSVQKYEAQAITCDSALVVSGGNCFAAAMVRGTVKEALLPYFVNATLKANISARIRFVQ